MHGNAWAWREMIIFAWPNENYTMGIPIALIRAHIWRKPRWQIFFHQVWLNRLVVPFQLLNLLLDMMHPPPCIHTSRQLCNQMIPCVAHLMFSSQPNFHCLMLHLQCLILRGLYWLVFTLWHPNYPFFRPLHPSNNMRTWCHLLSFKMDNWLWKWRYEKKYHIQQTPWMYKGSY